MSRNSRFLALFDIYDLVTHLTKANNDHGVYAVGSLYCVFSNGIVLFKLF